MDGFLILLNKIAARAAPSLIGEENINLDPSCVLQQLVRTYLQEIRDEIALQRRLAPLPDLAPLQQIRQAVQPDARDRPPPQAAGVDGAVSRQVAALVQSVVRLAEGDAGAAAGDEAGVNGVEAAEERRGPGCLAHGVRNGGVVFGGVVGAGDPAVHVLLHFGFRGSHCKRLAGASR